MSFSINLPPSVVAKKTKSEEQDEPKKKSREDWRKQKELEEMRKAGTAPAMTDEEGKEINPHIPQYIMQAPWYYQATHATLKHQRIQEDKLKTYEDRNTWYKKGLKEGPIATKFRKGACENCGAMTHKKKDCLERPRKVGAKFTGDNIAPDEHITPTLNFDYEGKRDHAAGVDVEDHQRKVHEEYSRLEEAKRMLKEANFLEGKESAEKSQGDSEDEDKYADDVDMPGQKFETKQRITVRNLRIREDTAKYLYNLDPNSAFYDPKTRSMRENPYKNTGNIEMEQKYAGDNFVRFSGDAHKFATKQVFAWEAYEHGTDVHLQADPTKLELLSKEVRKRKEDFKSSAKDSILDKYGGEEHLQAPPKQLLLAQTEDYVEYSRHGSVIKGNEKPVVRSKYEEDVYINNHTSVWGSYWKHGRWGYKCCHNLVKESYCTGVAGIEASSTDIIPSITNGEEEREEEEEEPPKSLLQEYQEKLSSEKKKKKKKKKKRKHKKKSKSSSSSDSESEDEEKVKERKLREALIKEEEHQKRANHLLSLDERKRPYNSMYENVAPTEEEMEAWRLKQRRTEDPMSHFT
ncbi:pre-mRNA-splicing factor SLU7-like [Ostrea edulis]|uniref:pre-mRNA-splicing factor SLU7-like n=1 Tax=Ostrea edulis TaxID=37623 RepID=UPI0020960B0D|nr:pre-mRNA-splicing factor SLU7-like [Ostrea edulis]XP_056005473.1 pre-mRNA-splicing factor SLU7-like [Ostrea edulis]